jgi:hypothetical protein
MNHQPANVNDLLARITGVVAEVTPDMLCHTWEEIHYRYISVVLPLEVTSNRNSDKSEKT